MPGPARTRQACDRCHSQKLRCPKQQGSAGCTRCARTKAPCTFSAVGTQYHGGGGAARAAAASHSQSSAASPSAPALALLARQSWAELADGGCHVAGAADPLLLGVVPAPGDADWLAFDAAFADAVYPPAAGHDPAGSSLHPSQQAAAAPSPATATALEPEASPCGRKLAELQAEIHVTFNALPMPPLLHGPADAATMVDRLAEAVALMSAKKFIERVFVGAQRLADLYPEAVEEALGTAKPAQEPCQVPDCVHRQELPPEFSHLDELVRFGNVDMALAGQLLSCHLRLLDVLDRIGLYAFSCIRLKEAARHVRHPDFQLPQLKIGSFTPTAPSAQLMQAVLLNDLVDTLHRHFKLFAEAVRVENTKNTCLETRTLMLQTELLSQRHTRASKQLKSMSSYLVNRDLTER